MDESIIQKLRARIPDVDCEDGCCDCCTPFLWSEWKTIESLNRSLAQELTCKHLDLIHCKCLIYDRRPLICRIFGASEDPAFHCPRGRMAENPLGADETKEMLTAWLSLISDEVA